MSSDLNIHHMTERFSDSKIDHYFMSHMIYNSIHYQSHDTKELHYQSHDTNFNALSGT